MKRILTYGMIGIVIGILGVCFFINNTYSSTLSKEEFNTILENLKNPDWRVRSEALCYLIRDGREEGYVNVVREEYRNDERVRVALINFLAWETEQEPLPYDDYTKYVSSLCSAVASLKDPRALPYFLGGRYSRFNSSVDKGIVALANDQVVEELFKRITVGWVNDIEILGEIVKPKVEGYVPVGDIRGKIKQVILKILKEGEYHEPYVNYEDKVWNQYEKRKIAIRALGNFEDPALIPLIKTYLNDPYSEVYDKTEFRYKGKKVKGELKVVKIGKVIIYPVREEAQRVLKLLEEKKKKKEIAYYANANSVETQSIHEEWWIIKEDQLTFEKAINCLKYINASLTSFRNLTELIDGRTNFINDSCRAFQEGSSIKETTYSLNITGEEFQNIGNLDWAFQNIGFHNRGITIEGALLRQEAEIKRLQYRLLQKSPFNRYFFGHCLFCLTRCLLGCYGFNG